LLRASGVCDAPVQPRPERSEPHPAICNRAGAI
jgi:hypothetical protein